MDLASVRAGGKRALAEALVRLEAAPRDPGTARLLDTALGAPLGVTLGLTGPPGVGKSTLIDALIRAWRATGKTVAVIAVDPSSGRSGGALLGDRTRFSTDPGDAGVFVRSMAARDQLGGVAAITFPAMVLMRALYDIVIVETVGVGQSETVIAELSDLTAFCAQPGSGDALQYMKAGVMEVPDLVIVTKSDMGPVATRTVGDLRGALSLGTGGAVPVVPCSAQEGTGLDDVVQAISEKFAQVSPSIEINRRVQVIRWADRQIVGVFGSEGRRLLGDKIVDETQNEAFCVVLRQIERLSAAMTEAFR